MMKKIDKLRMSRYAMVWGMLFSALWLFAVAPLQAQTEQDKLNKVPKLRFIKKPRRYLSICPILCLHCLRR